MGCGEYCLDVEYRSMGESPDISGAWNVAERESGGGRDCGGIGWLGGEPWCSTVHWDRKLQEMSQGSTYRFFRQELCLDYNTIIWTSPSSQPH